MEYEEKGEQSKMRNLEHMEDNYETLTLLNNYSQES